MSQTTIQTTLGADVATGGTFTVGYPQGKSRGDFLNGVAHYAMIGQDRYNEPAGVAFTFNAANITVTYKGATTQKAGQSVILNLDEPGGNNSEAPFGGSVLPANVLGMQLIELDLGSPQVADPDGIAASQSVGDGANALINGALASGGVATFDVPRNVVAAWTGTAVLTVEGTDKNGKPLKESSASGTSLAGKKAFKTITKATFAGAVTAATIGSGDVLGLPSWLPASGHVLRELQDGATAAAGSVQAGLATGTASTATTGDVRGTYDPNAACDGAKAFKLIVALEDPAFQGPAQFAG